MNTPDNLAVIVFQKLEYFKLNTCPLCNNTYTVNSDHFYVYASGALVSLKCKACYGPWRKELKKNPIHKLTKKISKLVSTIDPLDMEHHALVDLMNRHGFNYLGRGASRTAFEKNGYVVKIETNGPWRFGDSDRDNKSQTELEIENFEKLLDYPKAARDLFIQLLAYGKNYIIVRKADLYVRHEQIERLRNKLVKYGISTNDVREKNVGIVKNKVVVIDYALCRFENQS